MGGWTDAAIGLEQGGGIRTSIDASVNNGIIVNLFISVQKLLNFFNDIVRLKGEKIICKRLYTYLINCRDHLLSSLCLKLI